MKKRNGWFYVLTCLLISCSYHDDNTSISYKDKEDLYAMKAHFKQDRNKAVENYLNEKIGNKNNISFSNLESDADLTLNDGTKFYLKKYAGHVEIQMDKSENSNQAYYALKEICRGMKEVVIK